MRSKITKRIAALLILALLAALLPAAAMAAAPEQTAAADALHALGLFQGTGTAPDL